MFCNLEYVVEAKAILLFINFGGVDVGGLSDDLTQYLKTFKWGYVKRGIYAMSCGSFFLFFLSPPISYQLFIFYFFFPSSSLTWKRVKRIYDAAKTEKANTLQFWALKGEKREKSVWFVFMLLFFSFYLSPSLSILKYTHKHTLLDSLLR